MKLNINGENRTFDAPSSTPGCLGNVAPGMVYLHADHELL
jgi:hypothetical protein